MVIEGELLEVVNWVCKDGIAMITGDLLEWKLRGRCRQVYLLLREIGQSLLPDVIHVKTYDLARVFLLLRLRRRTRFFLHFALIFDQWETKHLAR